MQTSSSDFTPALLQPAQTARQVAFKATVWTAILATTAIWWWILMTVMKWLALAAIEAVI